MKTLLTPDNRITGWFPFQRKDEYSEEETRWFDLMGAPYDLKGEDVLDIWLNTGTVCARATPEETQDLEEDAQNESLPDWARDAIKRCLSNPDFYRDEKFEEVSDFLSIDRAIVGSVHDAIMREFNKVMDNIHQQMFPSGGCAAKIDPKVIDWIWHPYLAAGKITLIGARGGTGKGLVCQSLAAAITGARSWPDGKPACDPPGNVLWLESEDDIEDTLIPRMIAAGVNRHRVVPMDAKKFDRIGNGALSDWLKQERIKLIVVSPLLTFLRELGDKNDEMQVRDALEKLQGGAKEAGSGVVAICHVTKKSDLASIERILGSVAFTNFVRVVLLVAKEPAEEGEERKHDVFRMVHAKHNASVRGKDLLYIPKSVGALHESDHRSQYVTLEWELAANNRDPDTLFDRQKPKGEKRTSAGDWIVDYLAKKGVTEATKVIEDGKAAGYTESALRGAKNRDPRIHHEKLGFPARVQWYV